MSGASELTGSGVDDWSYVVGVDVGGTFTDVVLADARGHLQVGKVVTTPDDPRRGVIAGIRTVLADARLLPGQVSRVVHGTTLATNVILERRGAEIAFITTAGFGDMLRLGREARVEDDRYDLFFTTPSAPVSHELTFEVAERIDAAGRIVQELSDDEISRVAAAVASSKPSGVAICLLHSYARPDHEQRIGDALRTLLPETYVVTSTDVWPEMREYERAMTTVLCAYVGPVMTDYLASLEDGLRDELGLTCPVEIMDSSGGVMSAEVAARRPIYTIESGGAAGAIAAGFCGRLAGARDVISFDMGGTTAKTAILHDSRPQVVHDFQVGGKGSFGGTRPGTGFPVKVPVIDLAEVGAGGGSIARVDAGGALRVGPDSSGAVPGPACYGRGGDLPTVTDANLVLGYLNPEGLAGGVRLALDLAQRTLERDVGGPLGLPVAEAALAVHQIANAAMAAAIRVVTVQRGIDPRGYSLVGFGGAGPMHAARLASTFGIETVAIPWGAGVASAVGLISAEPAIEVVRTRVIDERDLELSLVSGLLSDLEREAHDLLTTNYQDAEVSFEASADVRYAGQAHCLRVPVSVSELDGALLSDVVDGFHRVYQDTYGIELDLPIQLVNFRIRAVRASPALELASEAPVASDVSGRARSTRLAYFPESGGYAETGVHDWAGLSPGSTTLGPAIVEGADTTIVVPPGYRATLDRWRNVLLAAAPDQGS